MVGPNDVHPISRSACVVLLLVAAAIAQESYDQVLHHWDYDKSAPAEYQASWNRGAVTV